MSGSTGFRQIVARALVATAALSATGVALAGGGSAVGAVFGAGAGAVIGQSVGGHDGAVIGGIIGAVTGAAIGSAQDRHGRGVAVHYGYGPIYAPPPRHRYRPPPVYIAPPPVVYGPPPGYWQHGVDAWGRPIRTWVPAAPVYYPYPRERRWHGRY